MSTTQPRTGLILPDDGGAGGDDDIDVTAQISNAFDYLSNGLSLFHVADVASLPSTQNFRGRLAIADSTGEIWRYDSGWKFLQDTREQTSWKPTIHVAGGAWTYGAGGDKGCRYFRVGNMLCMEGWAFTGTTGLNCGLGAITFDIPFTALAVGAPVSWGSGTVNAHGEDFDVVSRIDGNTSIVKLYAQWLDTGLAANNQRIRLIQIQNCDVGSGGAPGTGIPRFQAPSNSLTWDVTQPGYINWSIWYPFNINAPIASA